MAHKLRFGKFGLAENPVGYQVSWQIGERSYLADVVGCYRDEVRGVAMLKVRYFNGSDAPDVAASFVDVLGPRHQESTRS